MRSLVAVFTHILGLMLVFAGAADAQDGAAVFQASSATCHAAADAPQPTRNPNIDTLRRLTPEAILNALLNGKMRIQAVALSDAERRAVAEFLGGRALEAANAGSSVKPCTATSPFRGPTGSSEWNYTCWGWNGNAA